MFIPKSQFIYGDNFASVHVKFPFRQSTARVYSSYFVSLEKSRADVYLHFGERPTYFSI